METIGRLTVGIFVSVLNGWTLRMLWGWFIVPTFHLPELGIVAAIGLDYTVSFIVQPLPPEDSKKSNVLYSLLMSGAKSLIFLGFGWLVSRFM